MLLKSIEQNIEQNIEQEGKSIELALCQAMANNESENPQTRLTASFFNDKLCQAIGVYKMSKINS